MENKTLHTILNMIKKFKTDGTSYYKIKRNIIKLNLDINLNKYLNNLITENCIQKKKNKYFYLQNKINPNLDLLIDEEESDSELEPISLKKNKKEYEKNIEFDNNEDSSDSDGMPYFVFDNDDNGNEDSEFITEDNFQSLALLLNILGNQLDFDDNDVKLLKDNNIINQEEDDDYEEDDDDYEEEDDDYEEDDDDEEEDDDEEDDDDDYEDDDDEEEKSEENKKINKSVKLKFKTRIEDITLLNDGIVENKKKPDDEEFEFEFNIPYKMIYKILKYIK